MRNFISFWPGFAPLRPTDLHLPNGNPSIFDGSMFCLDIFSANYTFNMLPRRHGGTYTINDLAVDAVFKSKLMMDHFFVLFGTPICEMSKKSLDFVCYLLWKAPQCFRTPYHDVSKSVLCLPSALLRFPHASA